MAGDAPEQASATVSLSTAERLSRLEEEVARLREELQGFRRQFD